MMNPLILIVLMMLSIGRAVAQEEVHDLVVKVENVKAMKGNIRVGVYDNKEDFLKKAIQGNDVSVDESTMTITFKGLKKGVYAVSLFHDKNENGKLDSNFLGIPSEPYAFSNNAKGMFGPPDFESCQFEVKADKEVTISL